MENQSTTTSQIQFLLLEEVQFSNVNDDSLLQQWELVNVVDAEEQQEDSDHDSCSWDSSISSPNAAPIQGIRQFLLHLVDDDDDDHADVEVEDHHRPHGDDVDHGDDAAYGHDDDDEDHDDDDDDDGYDLDDELVPWNVSNKLGRERMRKLGKRAFSKMHNSKRSPYLFVSPGCVRGKHGLGLKHNY